MNKLQRREHTPKREGQIPQNLLLSCQREFMTSTASIRHFIVHNILICKKMTLLNYGRVVACCLFTLIRLVSEFKIIKEKIKHQHSQMYQDHSCDQGNLLDDSSDFSEAPSIKYLFKKMLTRIDHENLPDMRSAKHNFRFHFSGSF